jgi:hypothetical protein
MVAVASMFLSILRELHDAKTSVYLGQKKTIEQAKASVFWLGMSEFATVVLNCVVCVAQVPKHNE